MIDTVKLTTTAFSLKKFNRFEQKLAVNISTGEEKKASRPYCNLSKKSRFSIASDRGRDRLILDCSLPKRLFGDNKTEIAEKDFEEICKELHSDLAFAGVSLPNDSYFDSWQLSRIDYCRNLIVERYISDYLLYISNFHYSRRMKSSWKDETVKFGNKSQVLTFYDKIKEMIDNENDLLRKVELEKLKRNILRVENRFLRKSVIQRELGTVKFSDAFSQANNKKVLLSSIATMERETDRQLSLTFSSNAELLQHFMSKGKRDAFGALLKLKGSVNIMQEFNNDIELVKKFLSQFYSRAQMYNLARELAELQSMAMRNKVKFDVNLLDEIKIKLAA